MVEETFETPTRRDPGVLFCRLEQCWATTWVAVYIPRGSPLWLQLVVRLIVVREGICSRLGRGSMYNRVLFSISETPADSAGGNWGSLQLFG